MLNVFQQAFEINIPADAQPVPTGVIDGSSAGAPSPENKRRANATFPFIDGDRVTLPANPRSADGTIEYVIGGNAPAPNVATNAFVEDFLGWHSAHQLQYIHQHGTDIATGRLVTFGSSINRLDVVISDSRQEVLTLQLLTKGEFGTLTRPDQLIIAKVLTSSTVPRPFSTAERSSLTTIIGAEPASSLEPSGLTVRSSVNALIQSAVTNITKNQFPTNTPGLAAQFVELSSSARAAFADQLNNIKSRTDGQEFLSLPEIRAQITAITDRADRADAFFKVAIQSIPNGRPTASEQAGLTNSLDNNVTIGRGLRNFIDQEIRIRDLDSQRLQMARREGIFASARNMDLPTLIANLQLNYNLQKEAEVASETEEVQQQNALLRDYATMQAIVNDVLKTFGIGDDALDEKRNIQGRLWIFDGPDDDRRVSLDDVESSLALPILMFDSTLRGSGHPIEILRNIERANHEITNEDFKSDRGDGKFDVVRPLMSYSQNAWNIFGTQLADAVTIINQQSQIQTNEISSLNRERNRHFDLANNALRRLNDSLQTIARI